MATDSPPVQSLKVPTALRLPQPLLAWVDEQAAERFQTRNAFIQDLLTREYLATTRG
jgi:metal-responsive CopG/Arc/MetJ family transcriptional regulator